MKIETVRLLKGGILLFWALWLSIVLASNLADGLKAAGALPEGWVFASGNYRLMLKLTGVYHTPKWIVAGLFCGVLIWEGVASVLFWRAVSGFKRTGAEDLSRVYAAFCVSLGLWAALLVSDEIFLAFKVSTIEVGHLNVFSGQLLSLLAIRFLPDKSSEVG